MMKGMEAISVVIIVGIIVSLVGTAYLWGVPIIQKRSTITEFGTAHALVSMIDNKITGIANTKAGTETIDSSGKAIKVVPHNADDPDNNSIIIEFMVDQPMVTLGTPVYLDVESFEDVGTQSGTYGISKPGIITLTEEVAGGKFRMRIKIHYRELDTKESPYRGYKILLETEDGEIKTGNRGIIISYEKDTVDSGSAENAGDLVLTHIKLEPI